MKAQKQCPYDKSWFTPTRSNQIYASRANQIAHKNERARSTKELTSKIDKAQKNNYRICKTLFSDNKESVIKTKDYLLGAGFDLNVFNCIGFVAGKPVPCVYEYYFHEIEKNIFKIGIENGKL